MSNVCYQIRPIALTAAALNTAKTFEVNMDGWDTLILQCDYTRSAGTALTFTYQATLGVNDGTNPFTKMQVNPSTGAITAASNAFTTSSSGRFEVPISISSYANSQVARSGNITVTVTCTAGAAGDLITITPIVARTQKNGLALSN